MLVGVSVPDRGSLVQSAPSALGCLGRALFKQKLTHAAIAKVLPSCTQTSDSARCHGQPLARFPNTDSQIGWKSVLSVPALHNGSRQNMIGSLNRGVCRRSRRSRTAWSSRWRST